MSISFADPVSSETMIKAPFSTETICNEIKSSSSAQVQSTASSTESYTSKKQLSNGFCSNKKMADVSKCTNPPQESNGVSKLKNESGKPDEMQKNMKPGERPSTKTASHEQSKLSDTISQTSSASLNSKQGGQSAKTQTNNALAENPKNPDMINSFTDQFREFSARSKNFSSSQQSQSVQSSLLSTSSSSTKTGFNQSINGHCNALDQSKKPQAEPSGLTDSSSFQNQTYQNGVAASQRSYRADSAGLSAQSSIEEGSTAQEWTAQCYGSETRAVSGPVADAVITMNKTVASALQDEEAAGEEEEEVETKRLVWKRTDLSDNMEKKLVQSVEKALRPPNNNNISDNKISNNIKSSNNNNFSQQDSVMNRYTNLKPEQISVKDRNTTMKTSGVEGKKYA